MLLLSQRITNIDPHIVKELISSIKELEGELKLSSTHEEVKSPWQTNVHRTQDEE